MKYHFNPDTKVVFWVMDVPNYETWKRDYAEWVMRLVLASDSWLIYSECRHCRAQVDLSDTDTFEVSSDWGVFCWFCVWGDQAGLRLSSST